MHFIHADHLAYTMSVHLEHEIVAAVTVVLNMEGSSGWVDDCLIKPSRRPEPPEFANGVWLRGTSR